MLHFVVDSDGDTDPDTDACSKGSRPGSSSSFQKHSQWR